MRFRSLLLLLCLCVSSLWGQSSLTPPHNVAIVVIKARTETELTLEWNKVNNSSYILRYSNGTETPLTVSTEGSVVTYKVSSLSPGTRYTFTLYTVFKGLKSTGFNFAAVTTPPNVAGVSVRARTETALKFEWSKVGNNNAYIYLLRNSNKLESYTPMYWGGSVASQTVSSLSPGTKYNFTLYTVFGGERSSGYNFSAITMPANVPRVNVTYQSENELVLSWAKVNNSISYVLRHRNGTEIPVTGSDTGSVVTYNISSLSPGTKYSFTLYTVFEGMRSRGLNFSSVTASLTVTGLYCEYVSGGSGLLLVWNAPSAAWTGVEVRIEGRSPQYSNGTRLVVVNLQPARWYNITLKLYSGNTRSEPTSISCQTDARGVIAGAILAALFIVFLVCLGVYMNHRRSVLNRTSQTDFNTNPAPTEGFEEGVYDTPVQAKPLPSILKKHLTRGSSQQKSVEPVQENPYRTPR